MKKITLNLLFCLLTSIVFSQSNKWALVKNKESQFTKAEIKVRKSIPNDFKVYNINVSEFKNEAFSLGRNSSKVIELPTPSGIQRFSMKEASSMAPELSVKFPMIKSYVAQGLDDPSAVARFSFGTDGFHGVIFYANKESFYIDPYTKSLNSYIAYNRSSLPQRDKDFSCEVDEQVDKKELVNVSQRNADDGILRTFRLAIVCSGGYAQYHLTQQGVSSGATDAVKKAAVLSAMNTSMTRINGVYERDLGVRMEIVANNEDIIFLDAATDNISDGSAGTMINEVQTICDSTIGSANYDIGHIFSIGGSGLATLGVVCVNGSKARGVTGIAAPIGDPYDIDYVAHEMGHQFGATHTQNNACNRTSSTAVEPGSASTIMGYAGICSPNVQNNSDDHFHAVSIDQMWSRIQSTANCAATTVTGNSTPTADAGADYSIPKSTPFVLKGSSTDADAGDVLSYNWEQIDNEVANMPPSSTNTSGPAFRSNSSISSPNRYMPALPTVIGGSTSSTWEVVPSVARDMNFSFVVRDNAAGGGNSARDDMKVTTVDITPFTVDGPSSNVDWLVGSTQSITWVVGSTNVAPVNSQNVNILLSTDGGVTFPITLVSNTPNDGTQSVVIPNHPTTSARIMVEAADNIFYNVNSTNFTISSSTPTFIANNVTGDVSVCNAGGNTATFDITLDFINGFNESVTFSTTGEPAGSTVNFSPTSINANGTVTMTVSNLDGATEQAYTIDVTASSSTVTRNIDAVLNVYSGTFATLNLTSPTNGGTGVGLSPTYTWDAISNAVSYDVEVAADSGFSTIISSGNVTTNSYSGAALNQASTYYWRVKANNICGDSGFSPANTFTTQNCSVCTSSGNTSYQTSTTRVVFNTIDNASAKENGGYSDFTGMSTDVKLNETHDLTVQANTHGDYTTHTLVWIDWNQDCDFDDANEVYDLGTADNVTDGATTLSPLTITIPAGATLGSTIMRVSTRYNTDPVSCSATTFDGEVEDYTINVLDDTASLNDVAFEGFNLYPNPSNGNFNLQFNTVSLDNVKLQLFDITGRLVKEINYHNVSARFSESISLQNTSKGLYLLKINNGLKQTTRKLIIE
ncbi:MAG: zinc-dependent metalloprotease [Flavobacteriaceae bacterium]